MDAEIQNYTQNILIFKVIYKLLKNDKQDVAKGRLYFAQPMNLSHYHTTCRKTLVI